ncbi:Glucose-6-phosphate 3-dehydrogenase [termite gut metagenome]|uniref:Glucose-6-phosphate 3-dehydrogenase n=1 Tax=termite gut metagenome TaxID=433724 RepID=A0A5J4RGJ0_9ZZZZ
MESLRIGLIGLGLIGKQHAESIGRIPGIELVAITEFSKDVLEAQKKYLRVNGYSDYKEMIDKERLDVIHNCTPNVMHYEINKYALEKGIHVYSEKPLAVTSEQGEELSRLAAGKGLANGVNFNYRSNAMVQDMKARIQKNDAGKCFLVHGHYLQDWLLYDTDFNWRVSSQEGGFSRALADIGSHWFDTAQVVLNDKVMTVCAKNFIAHPTRKRKVGKEITEYPVNTEDGGVILFETEGGVQGSVVISEVSGGYKNQLQISVDCEKYSMRWDQQQSDRLIIGSRENGETQLFAAPDAVDGSVSRYATLPSGHPMGWADAFTNGIREFYNSLFQKSYKSKSLSYSDFDNGTYIMKIVEACLKSNKSQKWEKVV